MTVNRRHDGYQDGRVEFDCVWLDGREVKSGLFDERALKKIVESVSVDQSGVINVKIPGRFNR